MPSWSTSGGGALRWPEAEGLEEAARNDVAVIMAAESELKDAHPERRAIQVATTNSPKSH